MRDHVNLLGILQTTWGGMGLLLGASLVLLAGGAAAIAQGASDPITAWVTAGLFLVFAGALAAAGAANYWAGRAIRHHQVHARTAALVLAVVNLFVLPFGTALGIYALWVLLHNDARMLFHGQPAL